MSKCFLIADLHLGHRKIIEYEPRRQRFLSVEEHDSHIERRWRETVGPRDVVYVVGDVAWNRDALDRFGNFPGIKKLVMGNHDRFDMSAYMGIFRKVVAYHVISGDILVAHIPVHKGSLVPRFRGQIHGHLHGRQVEDMDYVSVCAEVVNFTPMVLERVLGEFPS